MAGLHLLSPAGFQAAGVKAGIKTSGKNDVGLLVADAPCTAAAVFTTNKVFAAPVKIGREHVAGGKLRGVVVNAGNANACTGKQGEKDAVRMCALAAEGIGAKTDQMLPSSTGIIGHLLPMEKVERGIRDAATKLGNSEAHSLAFAEAILTTDLVRKNAEARVKIGKSTITIAGVCKGSGMIGPRMTLKGPPHATMLAYLTTDVSIGAPALRKAMVLACDRSFNAVTVDDHTSTNDTAVILASGASGSAIRTQAELKKFSAALDEVCQSLAYQIAKDGEGATKVVAITVRRARSLDDARRMARAIANSPLVKCAMHGNDPNWGRIVSAAGLCGAAFDPDRAKLLLQRTGVFSKGRPLKFDGTKLSAALKADEVIVDLDCALGKHDVTVWTCDLSKDYVTINADYHT